MFSLVQTNKWHLKLTLSLLFLVFSCALWYFNHPSGKFVLANFYFGGGAYNIDKARSLYESILKERPDYPGANYQLGRVYFIKGDFSAAWYFIEREIKYHPDFPKSYYMRGLVFGYVDALHIAEKDFLKFLSYKADSWAGWNDLAWVYFKKGDFRLMEAASRTGLMHSPNNPWLLNSLGLALYNQDRAEEARNLFAASALKFEDIGPSGWGKAYPGNDPRIYKEGFNETLKTVRNNLINSKSGVDELSPVDKLNSKLN